MCKYILNEFSLDLYDKSLDMERMLKNYPTFLPSGQFGNVKKRDQSILQSWSMRAVFINFRTILFNQHSFTLC